MRNYSGPHSPCISCGHDGGPFKTKRSRVCNPCRREIRSERTEYHARYDRDRSRATRHLIEIHRDEYERSLAREREREDAADPRTSRKAWQARYYRARARTTRRLITKYRDEYERYLDQERSKEEEENAA